MTPPEKYTKMQAMAPGTPAIPVHSKGILRTTLVRRHSRKGGGSKETYPAATNANEVNCVAPVVAV